MLTTSFQHMLAAPGNCLPPSGPGTGTWQVAKGILSSTMIGKERKHIERDTFSYASTIGEHTINFFERVLMHSWQICTDRYEAPSSSSSFRWVLRAKMNHMRACMIRETSFAQGPLVVWCDGDRTFHHVRQGKEASLAANPPHSSGRWACEIPCQFF